MSEPDLMQADLAASEPIQPRELTGRMVLACLVGFFAIVMAVNAVMMTAAVKTFAGLADDSPYLAGLAFEQEIVAARAQQALHWQVQGKIVWTEDGQARLELSARDANGSPLPGLTATATLVHPTDRSLDHDLAMTEVAAGQFRGETMSDPGNWDLVIELARGGERQFRSRNRVVLR
ncbi:MAG TPA: FixH family protein [Xanthobacteraceae bacterium]|nr:FixH family protein [Xanthobacteraceae bacterium]